MKHKIVVTGGLGFIGSNTAVALIAAGYEVVIIDDLSNSALFILDRIAAITGTKPGFYQLDMNERGKLTHFFEMESDIQAVIHFAASKAVGESMQLPLKYFRNNLCPLINLLDNMQAFGIPNIIFSSSATVYGEPDVLPVTEATAIKPALSAYGSTKQMGEDMLQKVTAAGQLNAISLRYFNPVGAHESALLGELPLGKPNNLMPVVTQTAAGKIECLQVYGNDYDTPDGTCVRDYIHVTDLAEAHVKSCERLLTQQQESSYEVFNIGTGKGISVMEMIAAFEQYNGVKLNYLISARRAGDAQSIYADATLANNKLQWKARKGLKEMVTTAWNWQKQLA
ncbi:MAG TPA: UDP-glucose 4-epimerase GalE [Sediminibacterium sp.]